MVICDDYSITKYSSLTRGSEELLCSNGNSAPNGIMAQQTIDTTENNNESNKKAKLDRTLNGSIAAENAPSCVVHIRNLPTDTTDYDIVSIGAPFGTVVQYVNLNNKGQGFIEMETLESAQELVKYHADPNKSFRPKIHAQYSTYPTLRKNDNSAKLIASEKIVKDVNAMIQQHLKCPVIHIAIVQQYYKCREQLHSYFSRVGKINRIIVFYKGDLNQALIEYDDEVVAATAILKMNGRDQNTGLPLWKVKFSTNRTLNVKFNNDKSWDYTAPSTMACGDQPNRTEQPPMAYTAPPMSPYVSPYLGSPAAPNPLTPVFAASNGAYFPALHPFPGHHYPLPLAPQLHRYTMMLHSVLLVSNLNEELIKPDSLFTLFGVYGDVVRVKILYNKKDNALIQMQDPSQAQYAMNNLDKIKLYGKAMRITFSKHGGVQMPKEGQPDAGLTKDYHSSALHRFKKPGSKNFNNIYKPSSTLHLSNIPPNIQHDDEIIKAFEDKGFKVLSFKFFPKDKKMALIQLESLESAVEALITMHNFQLSESSHLRVSFSKSLI